MKGEKIRIRMRVSALQAEMIRQITVVSRSGPCRKSKLVQVELSCAKIAVPYSQLLLSNGVTFTFMSLDIPNLAGSYRLTIPRMPRGSHSAINYQQRLSGGPRLNISQCCAGRLGVQSRVGGGGAQCFSVEEVPDIRSAFQPESALEGVLPPA